MSYIFIVIFSLFFIISIHNIIEIFILKKKYRKSLDMLRKGEVTLCDLDLLEEKDFINWCNNYLEYISIYTTKKSSHLPNAFICKNKDEIILTFISKNLSKNIISQAVGIMIENQISKVIVVSTDICSLNILDYIKTFDKNINIIDGEKLIEEVKKLRKKEIEYLYLIEDT